MKNKVGGKKVSEEEDRVANKVIRYAELIEVSYDDFKAVCDGDMPESIRVNSKMYQVLYCSFLKVKSYKITFNEILDNDPVSSALDSSESFGTKI